MSFKTEIWQSTPTLYKFKIMFPGEWKKVGSEWVGPDFSIAKKGSRFYRTDTNEEIVFPKPKKRSHFIYKVLNKELGGNWERREPKYGDPYWCSPEHPFKVYRSGSNELKRTVYRRSDTGDIVWVAAGRKY